MNNQNQSYDPFQEGNQPYYNRDINSRERYGNGHKKEKTVLAILLAVMVIALSFISGCLFTGVTDSDVGRLAKWYYDTIQKNSYYASSLTERELQELLLIYGVSGLQSIVGDNYISFLTPEDTAAFKQSLLSNEFVGIGVTFAPIHNVFEDKYGDGIIVFNVYNDSPAEKAGIKRFYKFAGLSYTQTNGVPDPNGEMITINWSDADMTKIGNDMRAIPADFSFTLIMEKPTVEDGVVGYNGELEHITLQKTKFNTGYASYYDNNSLEAAGLNMDSETAIVHYSGFELTDAADFVKCMETFKTAGKKNLILDMRYNGGGYLSAARIVASYLIKDSDGGNVQLGYDEYANGAKENIFTASDSKYDQMGFENVIVLVNGMSASATELVLMAMNYFDTASAVIGQKTFGKGIKQDYFFQNNLTISGYGLKLTVSKLFDPDGNTIHGIGITPNILVEDEINDGSFSTDNGILKAIEYLANLHS